MEENPYQSPQSPSAEIAPTNLGNLLKFAGRVLGVTGLLLAPILISLGPVQPGSVLYFIVIASPCLAIVGLFVTNKGKELLKQSSR